MAGFRELLAIEWDDNAVETFKLNFPDVPVYHGDIAKISVEDVLQKTGLKPGELDIFDGSPPCQGFSTAGKRVIDDPRNSLFREYVRLLRGLQPKVFVMENVSGMVKGIMKIVFVEILRELKASGYQVSARLLNAMYFGVPQSRQRMIFIGVRNDLGILPTHPKGWSCCIDMLSAICGADISGCPQLNDKYGMLYDKIPQGKNAAYLIGKGYNNCVKPKAIKPCCTIPKTQTGRGFATIVHPTKKRGLSTGEAKRIASFPDKFNFIGGYSVVFSRIGNSVPPLFMKSIAEHIRDNMLTGRCDSDLGAPSKDNV
jgi:DNA (cytosine-5)-methyltransferase 1